ncbi:MAG: bacterioferritin [Ectothiorhodospiraceae bacterium]|nr:bacterioferritin [Ectothiorhodospiraceae bacterium]
MKGSEAVIEALQNALTAELTAINQYFVHAEMFEDWGYTRIGNKIKMDSIDEMKHAEVLIERMLYFEAKPNVTKPLSVKIGDKPEEMLKNDLALEYEAVAHLNKCIKLATEEGDNGSRDLFLKLLNDEEGHVDWLEAQLDQIEQMGIQNYLLAQAKEEE